MNDLTTYLCERLKLNDQSKVKDIANYIYKTFYGEYDDINDPSRECFEAVGNLIKRLVKKHNITSSSLKGPFYCGTKFPEGWPNGETKYTHENIDEPKEKCETFWDGENEDSTFYYGDHIIGYHWTDDVVDEKDAYDLYIYFKF